jgi:peroxiredoxin Q/BCP
MVCDNAVMVLAVLKSGKYAAIISQGPGPEKLWSVFECVYYNNHGVLMVSIGKKVSNFSLPATGDNNLSLKNFKGRNLVLYFYPKDSTSGCTLEGQNFRDKYALFLEYNTEILGVSRDSLKAHENFKAKQGFPFELLSDQDETLCRQFDVIHEKNMYGRKFMGLVRSTFLIDRKGILRQEWRKVRVKGHVDEVLDAVRAL